MAKTKQKALRRRYFSLSPLAPQQSNQHSFFFPRSLKNEKQQQNRSISALWGGGEAQVSMPPVSGLSSSWKPSAVPGQTIPPPQSTLCFSTLYSSLPNPAWPLICQLQGGLRVLRTPKLLSMVANTKDP
jgi:hypothetical protein